MLVLLVVFTRKVQVITMNKCFIGLAPLATWYYKKQEHYAYSRI